MARSFSSQFSESLPRFVLVITLFIFQCSTISFALKMETSFPTGVPAPDGSAELVAQLRMQGALPTAGKLTQCTGFVLTNPASNPFWVVQITGHAPSTIVHHLAVYGCTSQPSNPCACKMNARTTIFVSSKNTPAIRFPVIDDYYFGTASQSGIQIGGASTIQYVFIEVHYNSALNAADYTTGVDLQYTTTPLTIFVGIISVMGVGTIPANTSAYNLDSCVALDVNGLSPSDGVIDIFGYQVHTHSLGRLVSVYTADNYNGQDFDEKIGRADPRFPQAYLPYQKGSQIQLYPGIKILLRCVFDSSNEPNPTYTIGVSGQVGTEMCFGNVLYVCNDLPKVNSFPHGTCDSRLSGYFPADSTQLFDFNSKLDLHAKYGNQTGTETATSVGGSITMDLDKETF